MTNLCPETIDYLHKEYDTKPFNSDLQNIQNILQQIINYYQGECIVKNNKVNNKIKNNVIYLHEFLIDIQQLNEPMYDKMIYGEDNITKITKNIIQYILQQSTYRKKEKNSNITEQQIVEQIVELIKIFIKKYMKEMIESLTDDSRNELGGEIQKYYLFIHFYLYYNEVYNDLYDNYYIKLQRTITNIYDNSEYSEKLYNFLKNIKNYLIEPNHKLEPNHNIKESIKTMLKDTKTHKYVKEFRNLIIEHQSQYKIANIIYNKIEYLLEGGMPFTTALHQVYNDARWHGIREEILIPIFTPLYATSGIANTIYQPFKYMSNMLYPATPSITPLRSQSRTRSQSKTRTQSKTRSNRRTQII